MTDAPTIDGDDDLETESVAHPFSFDDDPESPIHQRLLAAINHMGAVGPDAEERYQTAIDRLFRHSKEVIEVIQEEYDHLPEDRYHDRWSLVQLLVELSDPASIGFIDDLLSSQIPPERSENPHHFTTVGEEVMIRTTAVEALSRIAAKGNDEALELLRKHAHHDDFSVKRACVQAYIEHGGEDARERLREELPQRDHDVLEIERVDVREVPQADGQDFLKTETSDVPPAEPPEGSDGGGRDGVDLGQFDPRRFDRLREFGGSGSIDPTRRTGEDLGREPREERERERETREERDERDEREEE